MMNEVRKSRGGGGGDEGGTEGVKWLIAVA